MFWKKIHDHIVIKRGSGNHEYMWVLKKI